MHPNKTGKVYDTIAHLWQEDSFNHHNGVDQHQRALQFVKNTGEALDVGCGCNGRFIDLLLAHNFDVEGLDISEKMIALARERHPNVIFHQQDICLWQAKKNYDFITAWDSLWHIPLEQQKRVFTALINSLSKNGVFIFSCGGTDDAGEHTDNTMGPEVYYASLGINGFLELFITLGVVCRHFEYDQHPERHTYFIVQKI